MSQTYRDIEAAVHVDCGLVWKLVNAKRKGNTSSCLCELNIKVDDNTFDQLNVKAIWSQFHSYEPKCR